MHLRARRNFPLVFFDQVVQLDEIYAIHSEPFERPFDALARSAGRALTRLGREEELPGVRRQPRRQTQLGVTVARGRVYMVHAELAEKRQDLVGARLLYRSHAGRAENHTA